MSKGFLPVEADGGWHRGDWMQTFTGIQFYPLSPRQEDVHPMDIAHALGMICRYGGHVDRFYSVAEHCVRMSEWIENRTGDRLLALEALLHDASEAYVGDMVRPLKHSGEMGVYIQAEAEIELAIADRFRLPTALRIERWGIFGIGRRQVRAYVKSDLIKQADTRILLTERTALMASYKPSIRWQQDGMEPLDVTIEGWLPEEATARYLDRLLELGVDW